jgi:hypothetical protein
MQWIKRKLIALLEFGHIRRALIKNKFNFIVKIQNSLIALKN